ncbi:MAG TPA: hypothetical protein VMJ94_03550, partial [Nitrososphaera sp.]|nr:hypothetical protein [Nitrososphaera sp.]
VDVSWDGPHSKDRAACPYPVDFQCKPAPAETLNSLESGRLLLHVDLGGGVRSVSARMINNAKRENLGKVEGTSELNHKTLISARLVQDRRQSGRWAGELSIPSSRMEGGTRTYERTGAASPKSEKNLYALEITYALESGDSCTARFGSEDAFHWEARPKSTA